MKRRESIGLSENMKDKSQFIEVEMMKECKIPNCSEESEMKEVILSADNKCKMYLVPDEVADKLFEYCCEFASDWIWKNPNGAKLLQRHNGEQVAVYDESDFIEYLNEWLFPEQPSTLIRELDYCAWELPNKYKIYPQFNF